MALPVATIIGLVPWGTVLENAPAMAKKAREVFDAARGNGAAAPVVVDQEPEAALIELRGELERVQAETVALAEVVAEMAAASQTLTEKTARQQRLIYALSAIATTSLACALFALFAG
ncbi:MAG: hypothetical protein V2J26_11235 [Pacificimonas sp.]|jgi:hypothetical protein|nr:hypothetical protein [Pacificimonas sp.]